MTKATVNEEMYDRVYGCLLAGACGDALGAPVETMTPEEILAATGGKGITEYRSPLQKKIPDTMGIPRGHTTDDTQLTLAVADSLVRTGRFDLYDQGRALVEARFGTSIASEIRRLLPDYVHRGTVHNPSTQRSWQGTGLRLGKTTENSVLAMANFFAGHDKEGRDPEQVVAYKEGEGGGNGPSMKVAPLAIVYPSLFPRTVRGARVQSPDPFLYYAFALARQTHGDIVPAHGSVAIGAAVACMLALEPSEARSASTARSELTRHVLAMLRTRESLDKHVPQFVSRNRRPVPRLSVQVETAIAASDRSVDALRAAVGNGFLTTESVPFAIGIALRNIDDPERGLLEAANAGGDADTNASMVGHILGALHGAKRIPRTLVDGLPKAARLDLAQAARGLSALREKNLNR